MESPVSLDVQQLVHAALQEDLGSGDVTTLATVPKASISKARMVAREDLCFCGGEIALATFEETCRKFSSTLLQDAQFYRAGTVLMEMEGDTQGILMAERVALNIVQYLSGIATLTHTFVQAIAGTSARILDTRKTLPGWRHLAKYAVRCGGGQNHRLGLHDMVLVKDNHLAALRSARPNPVAAAIKRARIKYPALRIEVEADNLTQVRQAVQAGADIILLDNMDLGQVRQAVALAKGRAQTEASGGVNLQTVRPIAKTGVDFISVGALTHSAKAVDIGLDFVAV